MAKYQTKTFNGVLPIVLPRDAAGMWVMVPIEFPTTAPSANDIAEVCELPIGVRVLDWSLSFPDIDSNATPTIAHSLGVMNAGNTDIGTEVWGSGLTAGQSAAVVRNASSVCSQGDVTTIRRICLKHTAAAATWAGADKTGHLLLLLQA